MSLFHKKHRQKTLLWALLIVALLGGLWWLSNMKKDGAKNNASIELSTEDWIQGSDKARVTLIEYGDFQCPACATYEPVLKELKNELGEDLRFVYRHYPLSSIHPFALSAAQAAEASGKQGKFWEMHDMLYAKQGEWAKQGSTVSSALSFFGQYAKELGLNTDQFGEDMRSGSVRERIQKDINAAMQLKLRGTPAFLVNGEYIESPSSKDAFIALIKAARDNAPLPAAAQVSVHEHADLAVYMDGKKIDFSQSEYQSTEEAPKHDFTHFHDGNGEIVHKHRTGITLNDLFESIGMSFSKACFSVSSMESYCNSNSKSLKFFVNGKEESTFGSYEIKDLDRILISYGSVDDTAVQGQLASITDKACIYSEKCPERGAPPDESCVGGLGTDCVSGDSHEE